MQMKLETNRLALWPINLEDKDGIFEYRSKTEINKYQDWIPRTIGEVESFIAKTSKQINEPENQPFLSHLLLYHFLKQNS